MSGVGSGEVNSIAPTAMLGSGYEGLELRERERTEMERENFDFAILGEEVC